jgi:uncharacterized protein (TIGR04255 family)
MPYKRAPVTEAVIELRFAEPIDQETVEKAARRVRDDYTFEDPDKGTDVHFDVIAQKAQFRQIWSGVKLLIGSG